MSLTKLAIFSTERRVQLDCLEESMEEQTNAISTVENVSTHMVENDTGTISNQVGSFEQCDFAVESTSNLEMCTDDQINAFSPAKNISTELVNNAVNMVTKQVVSVEQHDFAVGSGNVPSTNPVQAIDSTPNPLTSVEENDFAMPSSSENVPSIENVLSIADDNTLNFQSQDASLTEINQDVANCGNILFGAADDQQERDSGNAPVVESMFPVNENVPIHYLQNEPFYANQGMPSDGAYRLPNMWQDLFQRQGASASNSMLFNTTNESLNRYLAGFIDQGGMDFFNDMLAGAPFSIDSSPSDFKPVFNPTSVNNQNLVENKTNETVISISSDDESEPKVKFEPNNETALKQQLANLLKENNSLKTHCEILQAQVQQMNQDEPSKMHESIEFHPTTSSTVRENQENEF